MSPVSIALTGRVIVLLALLVIGGQIGAMVMRGVTGVVGSSLAGAGDAERLVDAYQFAATLLAIFIGVLAAQVWLQVRRLRAGETTTMWLSVGTAALAALAAPALLWVRADAAITEYPDMMRGTSAALAGFLPPVAMLSAAAWWQVATLLPLPGKSRRKGPGPAAPASKS